MAGLNAFASAELSSLWERIRQQIRYVLPCGRTAAVSFASMDVRFARMLVTSGAPEWQYWLRLTRKRDNRLAHQKPVPIKIEDVRRR